jgi:hypothetical protein
MIARAAAELNELAGNAGSREEGLGTGTGNRLQASLRLREGRTLKMASVSSRRSSPLANGASNE